MLVDYARRLRDRTKNVAFCLQRIFPKQKQKAKHNLQIKMPNWYWEKKELRATPSQEMGMDFDTETRYRREGVR